LPDDWNPIEQELVELPINEEVIGQTYFENIEQIKIDEQAKLKKKSIKK
jgi:hypothetical protein